VASMGSGLCGRDARLWSAWNFAREAIRRLKSLVTRPPVSILRMRHFGVSVPTQRFGVARSLLSDGGQDRCSRSRVRHVFNPRLNFLKCDGVYMYGTYVLARGVDPTQSRGFGKRRVDRDPTTERA